MRYQLGSCTHDSVSDDSDQHVVDTKDRASQAWARGCLDGRLHKHSNA